MGLELTPLWDVSVTGSGLPHCVTTSALGIFFLGKKFCKKLQKQSTFVVWKFEQFPQDSTVIKWQG